MPEEEKQEKPKEAKQATTEISPLKDHVIHFNEYHKELKKGERAKVQDRFLKNLKTEKVIK